MINFGALLSNTSNFLYTYILIALLIFAGLYFTVRTRGVQFRLFPEALRVLGEKKKDGKDISSFQALMISTASRVGTGNIAGVATAITFGGPGAIFWMWMVAFLGASSAFVESTLGQVYKEKINGEYRGGPAFYIERGLGIKWFAWLFAIVTIFSCGLFLPGVQANAIATSMENAFGIAPAISAGFIAALLSFIVFGGLKRIATFTTLVVPFMAQAYVIFSLVIVFMHVDLLDDVLVLIVKSAFGVDAAFGAIIGLAEEEGAEAFFSALETGLTPEEQKKDKSTMPGMSENPFDKVYLVTPAGGDDEMTARLTEKAKYHFDAEMCTSIAEAVELAHANTRRGLLVCGGEAAALEAAELLVNS